MAKNLETFPKPHRYGRPAHPWDDWLDGQVWELTRGADFQGTPKAFAKNARNTARARGKLLKVHVEANTVVIQARPRNDQET